MRDFWHFARLMLRRRRAIVLAICMAFGASLFLGAGTASCVPIMKLLLDDQGQTTLVSLARDYNQGGHVFSIPEGLIAALPADPYQGVILIIGSLMALSVLGGLASFIHQYLSLTIATGVVTRIRQQVFHHVVAMPLARVVERGPSEFVARVVRDAAELQKGFLALVRRSVVQVTRGLAFLAAAVVVSWEVTLVAPIFGVLFAVILRKSGKRIRRGTRGSLQAQEQLLRVATESVQGLRTVKVSRAEGFATWRFHRHNKDALREELKARMARAVASPLLEVLASIMVSGVAILFAGRILRGGLTPEQFVVALGALAGAGASFRPLTGIVQEIQACSAPATRLREILREPRDGVRARRVLPRHQRDIVLEGVTVLYPGATRPALDDVSLSVRHGERVALVGPNGSGKTTLVSLLPRLIRPQAGRILIDGIDIESVSVRSLRAQMAAVTQETVLFRASIADNIALGRPGATRDQVVEAARRAQAHDFVARLPGGYDADLAEQGASLSGGQRQRIAIARAILRDPSILILDEATSQIDAESEARIASALREFCSGRTALIVAHRLSTVRDADRIVVMEDGRVIDDGPHDQLLARCDLYRRLAHTQLV
jgi:ABC-type multidrug transport system fused ATPase/permease subunit